MNINIEKKENPNSSLNNDNSYTELENVLYCSSPKRGIKFESNIKNKTYAFTPIISNQDMSTTHFTFNIFRDASTDIGSKEEMFNSQKSSNIISDFSISNLKNSKLNNTNSENKNNSSNNNNNYIRYKRGFKNTLEFMDISEPLIVSKAQNLNSKIKENKKILNISANGNHIISNPNSFLQNGNPIFLNIKSNQIMRGNQSYNLKRNKRINTSNSGYNLKNSKIINSQIFNNYYSINNIDASNIPVRVINFYN